jgi:hypothetical protein
MGIEELSFRREVKAMTFKIVVMILSCERAWRKGG